MKERCTAAELPASVGRPSPANGQPLPLLLPPSPPLACAVAASVACTVAASGARPADIGAPSCCASPSCCFCCVQRAGRKLSGCSKLCSLVCKEMADIQSTVPFGMTAPLRS